MWDQGGINSQEQPWSKGPFPHQCIHTIIFLSYFEDTETPSRWEKLMINDGMLLTSMQTPEQLDLKVEWCGLLLTSPPTHQKNVHELITPFEQLLENFSLSSPSWDTWFWRHEPAVSPFAWWSNTAIFFYFIQNSVSEIRFSTGVQRNWAFGISLGGLRRVPYSY